MKFVTLDKMPIEVSLFIDAVPQVAKGAVKLTVSTPDATDEYILSFNDTKAFQTALNELLNANPAG